LKVLFKKWGRLLAILCPPYIWLIAIRRKWRPEPEVYTVQQACETADGGGREGGGKREDNSMYAYILRKDNFSLTAEEI